MLACWLAPCVCVCVHAHLPPCVFACTFACMLACLPARLVVRRTDCLRVVLPSYRGTLVARLPIRLATGPPGGDLPASPEHSVDVLVWLPADQPTTTEQLACAQAETQSASTLRRNHLSKQPAKPNSDPATSRSSHTEIYCPRHLRHLPKRSHCSALRRTLLIGGLVGSLVGCFDLPIGLIRWASRPAALSPHLGTVAARDLELVAVRAVSSLLLQPANQPTCRLAGRPAGRPARQHTELNDRASETAIEASSF